MRTLLNLQCISTAKAFTLHCEKTVLSHLINEVCKLC